MKTRTFICIALATLAVLPLRAQTDSERYIEVTGTSEIEIVPDRIHYIIEIKEYYEEEFDGKSKPEDYRTKVPLEQIEKKLRDTLAQVGIGAADIRTQEVGDYWRERGHAFLVSKLFDITLSDYRQLSDIVTRIDTRGVRSMRIGELENKDMQDYHRRGKIEALKAAERKAAYLVRTMGKRLGGVIRIVEPQDFVGRYGMMAAQSNVVSSDAASYDEFRTIRRTYSMLVRFEIADK